MEVEMRRHQEEDVISIEGDDNRNQNKETGKSNPATTVHQRNKNHSGIRKLLRHMNKNSRAIHPSDNAIPPQLIVHNGEFEVFDPEVTLRRRDVTSSQHIKAKTTFNKHDRYGKSPVERRGCFASIKWKKDFMKFKYGDLVPILRKHIKKIEGEFGSGVAAVFKFTRWAILLNLVLSLLWLGFLVVPAALGFDYKSLDQYAFSAENIFDGKGKLQYSWMFYGSYPAKSLGYRIDYAYIILGILTFFGSLLIILKSAVETNTNSDKNPFSILILGTWDFSVTAKPAKDTLVKGVTAQAKDMVAELHALLKKQSRTRKAKCCLYLGRLIAWTISSILTAGACATIYYFLVKVSVAEFIIQNTNVQVGKTFLEVYGFSLLFALLNSLLPFFIELLPKMESYEKGLHEVYVNIIRIFLLRFLNLFALIFTLYDTVTSSSFRGCGGTFIGQEFYKIILLDMAVATIFQLTAKFSVYVVQRMKKREPVVSKIVLQIVYRQALVWAGTFFCPIIPCLGILDQCLVFAINYLIVMCTCKAPSKRFKQTDGIVFFKGCLIVTLFFLLFPIVTIFASEYVSIGTLTTNYPNGTIVTKSCGPFGNKPPMNVLNEGKNSLPDWLSKVANWITSAAVFPAILVMGILIYIQHLRLKKERKKLKQLQIDYFEYQKQSSFNLLIHKTKNNDSSL